MPRNRQHKILLQHIIIPVNDGIVGGIIGQTSVLMEQVEGGEFELARLVPEKAITGAGIPECKLLAGEAVLVLTI